MTDPFSRDFQRIRRMLGGEDPPRSPGRPSPGPSDDDLPMSAQALRDITGLEWRPIGIPAPRLEAFWWSSPARREWAGREKAPLWDNNLGFATRRDGWVILYGARPTLWDRRTPELGYTVVLTHPELDEETAVAAFLELNVPYMDRSLFGTDSDHFPYVINVRRVMVGPRGREWERVHAQHIAALVRLHVEAADILSRRLSNGGRR